MEIRSAKVEEAAVVMEAWRPQLAVVEPKTDRAPLVAAAEAVGCTVIAAPVLLPVPGSTIQDLEKHAILRTLDAVGGSTSKAAKILGISVRKIQYRLRDWRTTGRPDSADNHDAVH
jgi:DNA-binding NtrC family response regulator